MKLAIKERQAIAATMAYRLRKTSIVNKAYLLKTPLGIHIKCPQYSAESTYTHISAGNSFFDPIVAKSDIFKMHTEVHILQCT